MTRDALTVLLLIYLGLWLFMIFESLGKISAILERHDERKAKELLKNEDLEKLKKEDMSNILSHIFIAIMGPLTFPVVFLFYRVPKFIKQLISFFKS